MQKGTAVDGGEAAVWDAGEGQGEGGGKAGSEGGIEGEKGV